MAMHGALPVVEIMFADFITLAFDQICNHAVKFTGMFPEAETPLVIRTPAGGRRGYGPTHSQSPETLLCAVPGLTVVFPSARHVPGDLLWNSVFRLAVPGGVSGAQVVVRRGGRCGRTTACASPHPRIRQPRYFRRWQGAMPTRMLR